MFVLSIFLFSRRLPYPHAQHLYSPASYSYSNACHSHDSPVLEGDFCLENVNPIHADLIPKHRQSCICILMHAAVPYNNNNNRHFYGAWSLARSRAQCAVQKAAEKCINTYNGQNKIKKVSGHTTANHARIYIQQFQ